jgi:hypothetical protein
MTSPHHTNDASLGLIGRHPERTGNGAEGLTIEDATTNDLAERRIALLPWLIFFVLVTRWVL